MTATGSSRSSATTAHPTQDRVIDLGGRVSHTFHFSAPPSLAYDYFLDVPGVFRLMPDTLDVLHIKGDDYRLIVGASDGYGHTMAAIFDLHAEMYPHQAIRLGPAPHPPAIDMPGLVFRGNLWAEAIFNPGQSGTAVDYSVELDMTIPIPGVLKMMPQTFIQTLGEKGMSLKMTQMITGFTRNIENDFVRWSQGG